MDALLCETCLCDALAFGCSLKERCAIFNLPTPRRKKKSEPKKQETSLHLSYTIFTPPCTATSILGRMTSCDAGARSGSRARGGQVHSSPPSSLPT